MGRVKGNVDLKRTCQKAQYSQWIYARHQRRQEMMPDREKWEWRCTLKKKTRKGREMAACKDRNNANQKPKWSKTRPYALCNQCGYTLHFPTPTLRVFPPAITSIQHGYPLSCVMNIRITWGRWCCVGIKSQQPTSQITQVAPRIICRMDEMK